MTTYTILKGMKTMKKTQEQEQMTHGQKLSNIQADMYTAMNEAKRALEHMLNSNLESTHDHCELKLRRALSSVELCMRKQGSIVRALESHELHILENKVDNRKK